MILHLAAFLLPSAILCGVLITLGVYPFGTKTLLTIDMSNIYIDYFSTFKDIFTGKAGFFYSFRKILGGNLTGMYAYYIASPLNLIFLFFDRKNFDVAVFILTEVKIGLCGLTMEIWLSRMKGRHGLLTVVFAACYALATYNLVYQLNIMWLDSVIVLPLVAMGIEAIVAGKKPTLYLLSLFYAVLIDYYIGYMICIFAVIWFYYRTLLSVGYAVSPRKRAYLLSA
ncbi:MAG TPA: YfhO family protein, partial [Armatimonadota bacterium]|nr:YfhO family protein [Armatimonadota bacterium]